MNRLRKLADDTSLPQPPSAAPSPTPTGPGSGSTMNPPMNDAKPADPSLFDAPPGLGKEEHEPSVEEAEQLVGEAQEGIDNLVDSYKSLFETLNNLAAKYPALYDELKLVVRFPNENDAEDIAQMQANFEDCADHYKDHHYLSGIIGVKHDMNDGGEQDEDN